MELLYYSTVAGDVAYTVISLFRSRREIFNAAFPRLPTDPGQSHMNLSVLEEILFANEAFYLAFTSGDFESMEDLWARNFDVLCTHPGWSVLSGRDVVIESWRAILANEKESQVECWNPVAHVYDKFAMVTCHELIDGNALSVTNAFVHEDGRWRIVHHHAGPMVTPPPRPANQNPPRSGSLH
jgi:hypothetical protein